MQAKFRKIHFKPEEAEEYSFLKKYENDVLSWIEKCSENKQMFINHPMEAVKEIIDDEAVIKQIEEMAGTMTLPYGNRNIQLETEILESSSDIPDKVDPPSLNYTHGWDCVGSAKVCELNKILSKRFSTLEIPYYHKLEDIYTVSMKMGMFTVTGGTGEIV